MAGDTVMPYRNRPQMVLFDVGGTLYKGDSFSAADGFDALRKLALNPDATDTAAMTKLWDSYADEIGSGHKSASGTNLDFPLSGALKFIAMNTGLRFDISMFEQEEIFDRFNSPSRRLIPGITELITSLNLLGIRTAVISNNAMSGESLSLAVKHWIPDSDMEFCLTSSDILLSKPDRSIFDTALAYAGLKASDCWYCGDSFTPDVYGAKSAGLTPVLIDTKSNMPLQFITEADIGEYMVVNNWLELSKHIENI